MEEAFSLWSVPGYLTRNSFWLRQLRFRVVRSEKLFAEAVDSSGTQRKRNVRLLRPLSSNGN
jgi:hypothetical protein